MKEYKIITDSASDLGREMRENLDVDYLKMYVNWDGTEKECNLDWTEFSPQSFYGGLAEGKVYKTAQVPLEKYLECFEENAKNGVDILYIGCSSALSSSVNTSYIARDEVLRRYPGTKIYCIDALNACLGLGLIVYHAANLKKEGKTIDEVAAWLEENKLCINQLATVEDLKYLRRSGRISGMSATMGNLLKLKPIIISDAKGQNVSVAKVKGRALSMQTLVNMAKEKIVNPEEQIIFISHGDCIKDATEFKDMLVKELGCKDTYINYFGPTVGATIGPNSLGVYFFGQKVTYALE